MSTDIAALYSTELAGMQRWAARRVRSRALGEDMAHDAVLRVVRWLHDDDRREATAGLLWCALHCVLLDHRKSRAVRRAAGREPLDCDGSVDDPTDRLLDVLSARSRLAALLARLSDADRELLDLLYAQNLPMAEVGRIQGRCVAAVKSDALRARGRARWAAAQLAAAHATRLRGQVSRHQHVTHIQVAGHIATDPPDGSTQP